MEPISVTCPKCGADAQIPEGERSCYCLYCGAQLLLDDGSKTFTYRTVDEARVREAELERRRIELDESHRPLRVKVSLALVVAGFAMVIIGFFMGKESGDSDSPWYMVSMMGLYALMGGFAVWYFGNRKSRGNSIDSGNGDEERKGVVTKGS